MGNLWIRNSIKSKECMNPEDAGSLENMTTVNGEFSESTSAQNLPINTGKYVDISEYRVQDDDLSIDDQIITGGNTAAVCNSPF